MTKQDLVTKLVNFIDSTTIPPKVETDHDRIRKWVNDSWSIAIQTNPKKPQINQ